MRRIVAMVMTLGALLAVSTPSYASVVTSGGPGKPIYAVSNSGSTAGQTNRSATGTTMKITNDGAEYIWDE